MTNANDMVGRQFGQYRVTQFITNGGMADVYVAQDMGLDREVALKMLFAQYSADSQFVERFQREARAIAKLSHPNIVQVYSTGRTERNEFYIAMEFVRGGTLADKLQSLRITGRILEKGFALWFAQKIVLALAEAHRVQIIHRDLKPSNILIREDNTPVLTDLGIAAVPDGGNLTQTDALLGTPDYMSPEQAQGQKADARSDIYSFGIMLYEILTLGRPFSGVSPWSIMEKHLTTPPIPIQQIRTDLRPETAQLVMKCLEKEPKKRYQTARDLLLAIERARQAEDQKREYTGSWRTTAANGAVLRWPVTTPSPPPAQSTPRHSTLPPTSPLRQAWLYWSIGGVFLLIVIFLLIASGGSMIDLEAFNQTLTAETRSLGGATSTIAVTNTPRHSTATLRPTSTSRLTSTPRPTNTRRVNTPTPAYTVTPRPLTLGRPVDGVRLSTSSSPVDFSWAGGTFAASNDTFYGLYIYAHGGNTAVISSLGHKQPSVSQNLSSLTTGQQYQWEIVLYRGTATRITNGVVQRSVRNSFYWNP